MISTAIAMMKHILRLLPLVLVLSFGCHTVESRPTDDGSRCRLTILTYNVLASEDRDEQRIPALFAIFENSEADILCLQEVEPDFLRRLKHQRWFRRHYHSPQHRGRDAIANGNYICSRHEVDRVELVDHRSPQGRQSLIVHLRIDGRPLAIATCHLESYLDDGPIRARQLDDVFSRLASVDDAIFAGDFNFGDGEQPESAHLKAESSYFDLWTRLLGNIPGFTCDIEISEMAARGSFVGETSRRIDRILVRSRHWRAEGIRIVGSRRLDAEGTALFPSDHFGLLGELSSTR